MKICHLVPVLASAQDDTSTLLSLKVHTALEAGVDHLLDAVGSRNVTQMSSLLQNLVEESIADTEGPYQLDPDVKTALGMIKDVLIGDIRGALSEAHCYDQEQLHTQMACFERCETEKVVGGKNCGTKCDGSEHKECREVLLTTYTKHIEACRGLDRFVSGFVNKNCPMKGPHDCCLLPHTTWNCQSNCNGKIAKLAVDNKMGEWLEKQLGIFRDAYKLWKGHFADCKASYRTYIELDAKCDCKQAQCETRNCEFDNCHYGNCEVKYNECWGICLREKKRIEEDKECLEKDRKIDWSATEKIECYVNVLLEKPTKEQLLAECGTEDCYSKYRERMYLKCNDICVATDYDSGAFDDHLFRKAVEGVTTKGRAHEGKILDQRTHRIGDLRVAKTEMCRTRHRAGEAVDIVDEGGPVTFEDGRCTGHLDLCYPADPCCEPCAPCDSIPCEALGGVSVGHGDDKEWDVRSYLFLQYGQYNFLSPKTVEGMEYTEKCHEQFEHTLMYAYNLCQCIDCPPKTKCAPATCTSENACVYGAGGYNYRQHDVVIKCADVSTQDVTPYFSEEMES